MTRLFLLSLLISVVIPCASFSQSSEPNDSLIYKKDVESIQSIMDSYYDCISGPIGQKRDFDRLKNLFHPEARLIYSYWNESSTVSEVMVFNTIEEFISKLDYLDKKGFYEYEIQNSIEQFSSISHVFSTYTYRVEDNSIPQNKGITSYQLLFDGDRYWIISMFWAAENKKYKIPKKYLERE
ncbi:hypothetical protein [Winogradskyella sp. 3972H.M.0a.05]|uniref:hypothetical protein n=1 Tax=Winogradskyella sp. 3972H.M.0a.05 TaxID=2950277 RepID=UPI003399DE63